MIYSTIKVLASPSIFSENRTNQHAQKPSHECLPASQATLVDITVSRQNTY